MKWSVRIDEKTEVGIDEMLTYTFSILKDDVAVQENVSVKTAPADIQQAIESKVTSFAGAYELASDLPEKGDIIEIIV